MSFSETFLMAWKNIMASKTRSLLTMLGIIIGVTAVVVIMGLGNGMENYMRDSFQSMGTNTMTVNLMGRGASSKTLDEEDLRLIVAEEEEYLELLSPTVSVSGTVKIGSETMDSTTVTGVGEDYFAIKSLELTNGRLLQYVDESKRMHTCVVGSYLNQTIFRGNALGQSLKINGKEFTIVGVLEEKADGTEGSTDDAVYLPYTTASRMSYGRVDTFVVTMVSEDTAEESKEVLEQALYDFYRDEDAYRVSSVSEMLESMTSMTNVLITILAVIAGISLVVGGIGIMNIMLVSVTERTKEIGIRKALGAQERYIMRQFVTEAAVTSALGGILGILLSYILSLVATQIIRSVMEAEMTVAPTLFSVLLAFGISAGIGVFFGYMPAKRAAQLNPIDALRYD
ncbi:MAG: ABC transporter permease [Bacillota bacterium]|nr:ABC transporter permease [Bacillota bacterium]